MSDIRTITDRLSSVTTHGRLVERHRDHFTVTVSRHDLLAVLRVRRDHTGRECSIRTDRTVIDRPTDAQRFTVVYQRLSVRLAFRRTVHVLTDEHTPIPSATGRYASANWREREAWDRFGVGFTGHPDRRRLLTDYGFEGHPLRKDFPRSGYVDVRYDEEAKRVVAEPLERAQEFRMPSTDGPVWGANPLRADAPRRR